ncbi:MAG: oligosaccharide flippase family protein, partial [Bacteroidales bacterium]|nr:oligosaccharide flippase family protein [Bacteroidales bacterium]
MSKSVKVNYILNLINTGTQLLLPLITFPYASRILFAEGIGKVNFFTSIITYISLFTCIGIPMYAIREIARVRDDEKKMSQTATEILLLHAGLTMVGYIIVALLCLFVPRISAEVPLFLLLSLTILFTAIGCEWFYQGIEDFAYITIRGLIVKALGIIFLFCFVKTREDIIPYAFFTVFGVLGGNLFNFF